MRWVQSKGCGAFTAYNGDGLRMSHTAGGNTTSYVWDVTGGLPVILQDGSSGYVCGLGSTRALTNGTGATVATYDYDAFGVVRSQTGTAGNPFKYTGQQQDSTELYYLRARYYDASTGRFISRDPFPGFDGSPQTQNPYAYVSNDPINATDPSGECLVDTAADVGFIGYDLYRLGKDNVFGKEDNLGENPQALGLDGGRAANTVRYGVGDGAARRGAC